MKKYILYNSIYRKLKLNYSNGEQISGKTTGTREKQEGEITETNKETFAGSRSIHCHDCGDSFANIYLHQNVAICII